MTLKLQVPNKVIPRFSLTTEKIVKASESKIGIINIYLELIYFLKLNFKNNQAKKVQFYKTSIVPAKIAKIELVLQKPPDSSGDLLFTACYIAELNQWVDKINSAIDIAKKISPGFNFKFLNLPVFWILDT